MGIGNMTEDRIWTAALVIIGNEVLSGRTQDENLAYLGRWLNQQGIRLRYACVVPDETEAIAAAVNECRARHDYVFTTGGIGPTHDDITIAAIAHALNVPLVVHPYVETALREHFGDSLTEAQLRLARLPAGAEVTPSADKRTGGIRIGNIIVLAGIPALARNMLTVFDGKLPGGRKLLSRTIGADVAENTVADLLRAVQNAHPGCEIASYPLWRDTEIGANFVLRATDPEKLEACATDLITALRQAGITPIDGELAR
jgi:molybdenum cofactor synthesis domain-containing protein